MKILVVDDSADLRELFCFSLRLKNHELSEASNGREALEKLESGARPELILLDLHMPVMDGNDFLLELERRADAALSNIPIICLSGEMDPQLCRKVPVLLKPVDLPALYAAVASVRT